VKVFISIFGHANSVSLPLRMGMVITEKHQQFAQLSEAQYDEIGSKNQRQSEIERGNRHYTGILEIPHSDENINSPYKLQCRVVLAQPKHHDQSPPVVTILKLDGNAGDMTVTKHIERMLKRAQISVQDLLDIFHPAYVRGEIQSSNDCEDIYRYKVEPLKLDLSSIGPAEKEILKNPQPVVQAIVDNEIDDVELKGPLQFRKISIPNVKYEYVIADAYIENVRVEDDMIKFRCIDSKGHERELHSFKLSPRKHLSALHEYAIKYLQSRQEQRALIAICNSEPCKGFFAESVTAISLQLMKTEFAKENI
jgi:hypothetical protein